jgi:negative regulator of genetic competence, sporulation and motility
LKTFKQILEETTKPAHVFLQSEDATQSAVENTHHVLGQDGKKFIYTTPNVSPEMKKAHQDACPNHAHCFVDCKPIKSISHAMEDVVKKISNRTPITLHVHPEYIKDAKSMIDETHGKYNVSVKPLPHEKEANKKAHISITKANAKELFKDRLHELYTIGDFVSNGSVSGEIINLHPKYATIVSEGKEHRIWIEDIELSEVVQKKDRIYKESFTYRGYKSQNLSRELAEEFKDLSKSSDDVYAVLNCLKSCDYVLGINEHSLQENFKEAAISLERAKKYSSRFKINISERLSELEHQLLQYALLEGISYSTTDKLMVARLIASVAGTDVGTVDPSIIINRAVQKFRTQNLQLDGIKLLGRMLNVATKSGIKWNKDNFSEQQQKKMGLI